MPCSVANATMPVSSERKSAIAGEKQRSEAALSSGDACLPVNIRSRSAACSVAKRT